MQHLAAGWLFTTHSEPHSCKKKKRNTKVICFASFYWQGAQRRLMNYNWADSGSAAWCSRCSVRTRKHPPDWEFGLQASTFSHSLLPRIDNVMGSFIKKRCTNFTVKHAKLNPVNVKCSCSTSPSTSEREPGLLLLFCQWNSRLLCAESFLGRLLGRFVENANPGSLLSLDSLLSNGRGIGREGAGTNLPKSPHPALEGSWEARFCHG